ncbi:MAG: hypothetical protein ACOC41_03275 [Chitinivibrionales bacterium]
MSNYDVPREYCQMWECKEIDRCDRKWCLILRESYSMAQEYGITTCDDAFFAEEQTVSPITP